MSPTPLALLLATSVCGSTALAANTITFVGEVTDQTCEVSINGQANPIVLLPGVPASQLQAAGSKAGLTPFTLTLTQCSAPIADMQLTTRFLGRGVTKAGNLGNLATDKAAQNVAIQLTENETGTKPINLSSGTTAVAGPLLAKGQNTASHTYAAQYYSHDGNASAGAVQAVVEYVISYM